MSFGYRTLWTQMLLTKVCRRGADAIAAWSHRLVGAWLDDAAAEGAETAARAQDARDRAERSRAAAAGTDLSAPAELIAAETELAEVSATIKAEILDADSGPRGEQAA